MRTDNARRRVVVVEDDQDICDSIADMLALGGVETETYQSARGFLAGCDREQAGCVLLDLDLPGMGGLELQRYLREEGWHQPVIFVTGYAEVQDVVAAFRQGAFDFMEKPFRPRLLSTRVCEALELERRLRIRRDERTEARRRIGRLTRREMEVYERVAAGQASKVVAAELGISERTVEIHRHHILSKLEVHNVAGMMRVHELAGIEPEEYANPNLPATGLSGEPDSRMG